MALQGVIGTELLHYRSFPLLPPRTFDTHIKHVIKMEIKEESIAIADNYQKQLKFPIAHFGSINISCSR